MCPGESTVRVEVPADPDISMPALAIEYYLKADSDEKEDLSVERCYVTISDRDQKSLKEYPMENISSYIYYNKDKKIAAFLFTVSNKEDEEEDDAAENAAEELIDFLEKVKDKEAYQAYRCAAIYWSILHTGTSIIKAGLKSGDLASELADEFGLDDE